MIKEVLPNVHMVEIPLPKNPLKALNSYVIKAPEGNLIIDTGMNREECSKVMFSALKELEVNLGETDFFITHMHADHSGLVSTLATDTSRVYCSGPDAEVINYTDSWEPVLNAAYKNGFPKEELEHVMERHPGYKYAPKEQVEFSIVKEGDVISIGDYQFRCVITPGHTMGHMCLYEPRKKILVSGDHILDDITPNISQYRFEERSSLHEYLASLDKVRQLDIELVLPGHRKIIKDHRKRIEELKHHHEIRAAEILSILEKGGGNAYAIASRMSWDIDCPSWEQFPTPQKWFATGEAIAHLKYLEKEGKVNREVINGINVFSLK